MMQKRPIKHGGKFIEYTNTNSDKARIYELTCGHFAIRRSIGQSMLSCALCDEAEIDRMSRPAPEETNEALHQMVKILSAQTATLDGLAKRLTAVEDLATRPSEKKP
jgi:hypothetical protein